MYFGALINVIDYGKNFDRRRRAQHPAYTP